MRLSSVHAHRLDHGFTLPEVMLALAVLLFIVAAVGNAVVAGQMHVFAAIHEVRATALAEAMMDEVLSKPWADPGGASVPGPDAGENDRGDFDNLDDYHGFTEEPGTVADFAGVLYPQTYQGFARRVTVADETVECLGADVAGLAITVTVTDADNRAWTIRRFVPEVGE